jgi:hypothetical protein
MMENSVARAYSLTCPTLDTFTNIFRCNLIINDFIYSYRADFAACSNPCTEIEIDFNPMIRLFPSPDI